MIKCMFCHSEDVKKSVMTFINLTRHLKVNCNKCKKFYFAPSKFITKDMPKVESSKLQKLNQICFDYFGVSEKNKNG